MVADRAYPDLAGLGDVLLEGAPVRKLVVRDDLVLIDVAAALLGGHPDYAPPARGEVHCRAGIVIEWRRPKAVARDDSGRAEPWTLHDLDVPGPNRFDLVGSFGRVKVTGSAPRIKPSRL